MKFVVISCRDFLLVNLSQEKYHIFVVLVFTLLNVSMVFFVSSLHLMLYFLIGSSLEGTLFTLCTMYLE